MPPNGVLGGRFAKTILLQGKTVKERGTIEMYDLAFFVMQLQFIVWCLGQGAGIVFVLWVIRRKRTARRGTWQWTGWWRRFRKHKLSVVSVVLLFGLYLLTIFCEFISPYDPNNGSLERIYAPPQQLHFFDEAGIFHIRPFVYGLRLTTDPQASGPACELNFASKHPVYLFVKGDLYKMWGLLKLDRHLFGLKDDEAFWFILGTDYLGRDLFSRILYGARVPLIIGLFGIAISLLLGSFVDSLLGYYSFVFGIPYLLLGEAWLTYLGLGVYPPTLSWSEVMRHGVQRWSDIGKAPWLLLPGLTIVMTVTLFILAGHGLRDFWYNKRVI